MAALKLDCLGLQAGTTCASVSSTVKRKEQCLSCKNEKIYTTEKRLYTVVFTKC